MQLVDLLAVGLVGRSHAHVPVDLAILLLVLEVEPRVEAENKADSRVQDDVVIDPLDGANNADAGVSVGSIWGVFEVRNDAEPLSRQVLRRGSDLVAAGYAMYGAATLFVANLPFRYSDDDVVALFAEVAPITSAQVVMDDDGRSRSGSGDRPSGLP